MHTGQHYDRELSQVFFDELGLGRARRLDLRTRDVDAMRSAARAGDRAHRAPTGCSSTATRTRRSPARGRPRHSGVPIAHVEAGLRSGDLSMPEEHNRIEVDRLAALLLCPDERCAETLRARGRARPDRGRRRRDGGRLLPSRPGRAGALDGARRLRARARRYVLATIHREANVGPERLGRILHGLTRLDEPVVFPAHPRTAAVTRSEGLSLGHVQVARRCPISTSRRSPRRRA